MKNLPVALADAFIRFYRFFDQLITRARALANVKNLIGKDYLKGQKSIVCIFEHFRVLRSHDLFIGRARQDSQQLLYQWAALGLASVPNYLPVIAHKILVRGFVPQKFGIECEIGRSEERRVGKECRSRW